MHLNQLTGRYISWLTTLTAKVQKLCCWDLYSSIVLFLINQVTQVLVVFVPLKLLVIIGSGSVPGFVKQFVPTLSYEDMITYLALGAGLVYFLYIVSDVILSRRATAAGRHIIRNADKVSLFDKQEDFTKDVFTKVARSWGGYIMVVGGMALGFLLDWRLYLALTALMVFQYFGVALVWQRLQRPENIAKRAEFIARRGFLLSTLSAINFAVVFLMMVYFFLTEDYNFLIAIAIILLTRQVMIRFTIAIHDGFFLFQQEAKISALFFSEVKLQQQVGHEDKSFIELLLPGQRAQVFAAIERDCGLPLMQYAWQWNDTGIRNLASFIGQRDGNELLLKIYPVKQEKNFHSDKLMFEELGGGHPLAMKMIAAGETFGVLYLLAEGPVGALVTGAERAEVINHIRLKSWAYEADESLLDRLSRSAPMVHERLDADKVALLSIADNIDAVALSEFEQKLPALIEHIDKLPLFIWNRNIAPANIRQADDKINLLHWQNVVAEPIGMGSSPAEIAKMDEQQLLSELHSSRKGAAHVRLCDLMLVAALPAFEGALNAQNFNAAAEQLTHLNKLIDECVQ